MKNLKFINILKFSIKRSLQLIYGKIKNYRKAKNTYTLDDFLFIWRWRNNYINHKRYVSCNPKLLKIKSLFSFPLITEPEVALHGIADDFFFQLTAINLLARDLPADYIIVVKEHVKALGRRPKEFYKQITDLRNVVIADPSHFRLEYINKSKAVACITGTAAWEAVVSGIPVI